MVTWIARVGPRKEIASRREREDYVLSFSRNRDNDPKASVVVNILSTNDKNMTAIVKDLGIATLLRWCKVVALSSVGCERPLHAHMFVWSSHVDDHGSCICHRTYHEWLDHMLWEWRADIKGQEIVHTGHESLHKALITTQINTGNNVRTLYIWTSARPDMPTITEAAQLPSSHKKSGKVTTPSSTANS